MSLCALLPLLLSACTSVTPVAASYNGAAIADRAAAVGPHASYVTIVLMENRDYDLIAGSPEAPYFNKTLTRLGALLTNSHAVTHPSEPNYLALFSGSTHGVSGDPCPVTFSAANLASELERAGKTFIGWAESMPRDGFDGCYSNNLYARKHDPWVDFTNVPASDNRVYNGLPVAKMPTVSWVTPNLCNDMHDCSTRAGDTWLSKNLPSIIAWDAKNDGLLIVTWDEADPDNSGTNHIATVFVGPMVKPGSTDSHDVDHYGILATIEKIFGLHCIDKECGASLVSRIWQ
jgi:acid phosphatase